MASRHLTLRVGEDLLGKLEAESRRSGRSRSEVAKSLLEEGIRMERHPGIFFRSGPTGRRPVLAAGPDVWEVARLFQGKERSGEEAVQFAVESMDLTARDVRTALGYYLEYKDEIDEWIRRNDEEADRAKAAWLLEQTLLHR